MRVSRFAIVALASLLLVPAAARAQLLTVVEVNAPADE